MNFIIRKALINDLAGIKSLYDQLCGWSDSLKLMQSTYETFMDRNDVVILVAITDDGEVIGAVNGYICPAICLDCTSFLVVEDFIVDEKHRHCGIGQAMMSALDDYALKNNCSYASLLSANKPERYPAHRFYKSNGFNEFEDVLGFRKTYDKKYIV